jgi:hypothetical protein
MNRIIGAMTAAAAVGLTAASASAQPLTAAAPDGAPTSQRVSAALTQLDARIDRRAAEGRLTPAEAQDDHAKANAIQAEADAERSQDGGQLTVQDRVRILSEIDQLTREVDAASPPR